MIALSLKRFTLQTDPLFLDKIQLCDEKSMFLFPAVSRIRRATLIRRRYVKKKNTSAEIKGLDKACDFTVHKTNEVHLPVSGCFFISSLSAVVAGGQYGPRFTLIWI